MKERGILFSAPMVRALRSGAKTQTRRIVKDPEFYGCLTGDCHAAEAARVAARLSRVAGADLGPTPEEAARPTDNEPTEGSDRS